MNKVSKLAVVVGLGTLLSVPGLFAETAAESSYVASYQGRTDIPVPIKVVSPESAGREGRVEVFFTVNESGKPTRIIVKSSTDEALVDSVVAAVSQWKFAPATEGGVPVAKAVVLPIRFKGDTVFASY